MLNIVRRSQVQGLIAMDGSTISHLGKVEAVWLAETSRVAYLSSTAGYLPLEQVEKISPKAVSTYGRLVVDTPANLRQVERLEVQSAIGTPLGWVEDFLFDWHTGEIAAYILTGPIAESWGESVTLDPSDVEALTVAYLILHDGAQARLKPASTGLQGFLSEKSHPVQHLVKVMSDRLHPLIAPHDRPDVVRIKVKTVSDELAASGDHDHHTLQEATAFLHDQWESLQQSINRSSSRAKLALNAAWKSLTGKS
jgi:hypothetical protein